jgi:hypothetical protein
MLVLVVTFGVQFGLGLLQSTFALYGEAVLFDGFSEKTTSMGIGLLLATVGLGQFFTQIYLLKRILPRFGEAKLAIGGSFLRAGAMLLWAVLTAPWLGPIAALTFAVGTGLMMPPLQSLATRTVADELRGGVLGVYQSSVSLSTIIATAISGTLFDIQPSLPYWVGGFLFMFIGIHALRLLKWSPSAIEKTVSASAD